MCFPLREVQPTRPRVNPDLTKRNGKVKCLLACLCFKVLVGFPVAFLVAGGRKTESKPSRASFQGPLLMPGPEYKQMPCTCQSGQLNWDVWQGCLLPDSFPWESPGERHWTSGFHWLTNDMMSHPSAGRLTTLRFLPTRQWGAQGGKEGNVGFFKSFLFFIVVWPVNNVVIVSGAPQRLSHIHSPPNSLPIQAAT